MDKVEEFRRRASECRSLAASTNLGDIRQNYTELAAVWDRLAEERLAFFVPPDDPLVAQPNGRGSKPR